MTTTNPPLQRRDRDATVITSARIGRSLDVHARTRRYLWTMVVRTVLFGAMFVVPGHPAKLACLVGAVVLPAAAVLLANDVDRRSNAPHDDTEPVVLPALLPGEVVRGEVVEEHA